MDLQTLTAFFMWCTIINGVMYGVTVAFCLAGPDFIFQLHSKWFNISRETFNVALYSFIGLYKILFIVFNVVPYVALLLIR